MQHQELIHMTYIFVGCCIYMYMNIGFPHYAQKIVFLLHIHFGIMVQVDSGMAIFLALKEYGIALKFRESKIRK